MREIYGDLCHELLAKNMKHALTFDETKDYATWKKAIKEKFFELVGMENVAANACAPNFMIEEDEMKEGYRQIRFTFESEKGSIVPCYLLIPDTGKEKYPVAITLQGHSTGFHNSIGVIKYPERDTSYQPRGAFALQAVKHGFAALAIEQRAMGERKTNRHPDAGMMCAYISMTAIQLGRTVLAERMWDVSKAIDQLANFDMLDTDKIVLTGNSGGGTMTYYASCFDERIKIAVPSCAFCSYETSTLNIWHCPCNYIPNAYEWFEMQDVCTLIAPRNLVVVAGKEDKIFPIEGVEAGFETVKKVYEKEGVSDKCRLVVTEKGHWWCEDIVWNAVKEEAEKLDW